MRPAWLLLLLPLAAPSAAYAATVEVGSGQFGSPVVRYVAAPGEANRVTAAYAGDALSVTVTDPGATITATRGCTALDAHTAQCLAPADPGYLQDVDLALGDGDDAAVTTRPGPAPIGGMTADGGPGDDVLTGSPVGDTLSGGGGTDTIHGGDGADAIADGDTDTTANADVLDGGRGRGDTITYAGRTAVVAVDLAHEVIQLPPGTQDGALGQGTGEGDRVTGFENAVGGDGDDELTGDDHANVLTGGNGVDTLASAGGRDELIPGSGLDRLGCGSGHDLVQRPTAAERLDDDCEELAYPFGAAEDVMYFPARPRTVGARSLVWSVGCPAREQLDGETPGCHGPFTVREAAGRRRLLAKGTIRDTEFSDASPITRTRLRLTSLGRQLLRREGGVRATGGIRGTNVARADWRFRLQG